MTNPRDTRRDAPAISIAHASFRYREDAAPALDDLTLHVDPGTLVCVLGANGSGKSTLLQLMNALLASGTGSVRILGIDAADPTGPERIRMRAAMVFQHPDDQMVTSIVADDVAFGPENLGLPRAEIARRVDAALAAVDAADLAAADPADLSGGQKQRVAIAGALAMEPDILLLDEPGAMLDEEGRHAVRKIARAFADRGGTCVHATHHMDDALAADRAIVLEHGRIAFDGTPAELFGDLERLHALGLEPPFAVELAHRLKSAGGPFADLPCLLDESALAREIARRMGCGTERGERPTRCPDAPVATATGPRSCDDAGPRDAIAFRQVSFTYAHPGPLRKNRLPWTRARRKRARLPFALEGIDLAVPAGCITALIGRTGAGKSTAAELACALKLPFCGTVRAWGIDTADTARRRDLRAHVGYAAQLPERQLFAKTVFEDVAFGPRNLGLPEDEVARRVRGALAAQGLDADGALLEQSPFALSGGQRRAVALAGVLAMEPDVLVLDEPMAGLDPRARARMRDDLARLRAQGTTVLVITHDMDDVAELADRVILLSKGHVACSGTPRQVFAADAGAPARAALPGIPHALALARLAAACGAPLAGTPLTVDELVREVLHGAQR